MRSDARGTVGKLLVWLSLAALSSGAAAAEERLLMEGRIKDQQVRILLDTGANVPFLLTPPAAAKLDVAVDAPPPAGNGAHLLAGFSRPEPMGLSPAFKPELVVLGILASDAEALEWDFDAVIGWPVLAANMLLYEPRQRNLFAQKLDVDRSGWAAFPIMDAVAIMDSNVLLFDAGKAGHSLPVMVDTGWSGGIQLSPARWKAWRAENPGMRHTLTSIYSPHFGLVVMEQALAKSISVGRAVFKNVLVTEIPPSRVQGSKEPEAVVGLAAFANHALLIDGPGRQMFIRPAAADAKPPSYNRLGAAFLPHTMAARVAAGSPAASADIRDGDILLKVDGLAPADYAARLPRHNAWDQPDGTLVRLTLMRDGAEIERQVVLQDFLRD